MAAHANMTCVCHVCEESWEISPFTTTSWQKFQECCVQWKELDGKERDVALASIEIVKNEELNAEYGYHRPCYQRSVSTFIILLSQLMHASYITFKC